jgi:hypothetical protein
VRPSLRQTIRRYETWWLVWTVVMVTELVAEAVWSRHLVTLCAALIGGFSLVQWLLGREAPDSELTRTQSEISGVFQRGLEEMCLLADLSKEGGDWGSADLALRRKRARTTRGPHQVGAGACSYLPFARLGVEPPAPTPPDAYSRPLRLWAHQVAPSMSLPSLVVITTKPCGYLVSTSQCSAWTFNNHNTKEVT